MNPGNLSMGTEQSQILAQGQQLDPCIHLLTFILSLPDVYHTDQSSNLAGLNQNLVGLNQNRGIADNDIRISIPLNGADNGMLMAGQKFEPPNPVTFSG